jgi:signal transduction histidine kinase/CheY-like chemotaxis protein
MKNVIFSQELIEFHGQQFLITNGMDITDQKRAEEEREKLQAQLNQSQKMASVGRLAGGVAHDFNNILTVILGNTEMVLEMVDQKHPLYEKIQQIQKAALRSSNIIRQLLTFASRQTIVPKILDLNEAVEQIIKMLRRLIGEDIDLSWKPGKNLWPVKVDPAQIDQIMANLAINARDAIDGVGKLIIETGKDTFDDSYCAAHPEFVPGDFVFLKVRDDGCGMDKETQKKLFEPFFTTKEVGKGTGLGLATVYGIVKQYGGFINVSSELNLGTTFWIYLPRHRAVEGPVQTENADAFEAHGSETILLVEDETTILNVIPIMLESMGYTVLTAATPGEAMDVAREHSQDIHLVLTDVVMPEMNGLDLAGKLLSLYPNLKCLFMSGYTDDVIAHHGILADRVNFIQKPFSKQVLSMQVRKILDKAN